MLNLLKKFFKILLLVLIFCIAKPVSAQNMETPVLLQVATFVKVFKYDTELKDDGEISLLIIYNSRTRSIKDEMSQAFKDAGVNVKAVQQGEIEQHIKDYDIVYMMPGTNRVSAICKKYKKLSITGITRYAEEGHASVALGLLNDKPRLFVNLDSLKQEGHTLSANLLKVVKVY